MHRDPVWRDRSDFIIAARIDPVETDVGTEQLFARKLTPHEFQICCIPFFVRDLALGDHVRTDATYLVEEVTLDAGHYTFRVFFPDGGPSSPVVGHLAEQLGASLEWSSRTLLAVDAVDHARAGPIAEYLQEQESQGNLMYETGRTS